MRKVAVIGLGTMGSAIQEQLANDYDVVGIGRGDNLSTVDSADVTIIAVKPQSFPELSVGLRPHIRNQLVVSIMAGICIESLASGLGTENVVRTMPNLALRAGKSLTAWYANGDLEVGDVVKPILGTWGTSMQLAGEDQFHAFTALAGSGPAYFYELAHLLEENALRYGFNEEQARTIGVLTLLGAGSILSASDNPSALVRAVASKGGTTEAAIDAFQESHLAATVGSAVEAAVNRSRELGS